MIAARPRRPRGPRSCSRSMRDGRIDTPAARRARGLFEPGDLVVANDAATLPASLCGVHLRERRSRSRSGSPAGSMSAIRPVRRAIAFGAGDHRTRTEDRPPPPPLSPGDRLALGPLVARRRASARPSSPARRCVSTGRPTQSGPGSRGTAGRSSTRMSQSRWPCGMSGPGSPPTPVAFEPPSAGFALDWRTARGLAASAASVSPHSPMPPGFPRPEIPQLDPRLPFDEPYRIPQAAAAADRTYEDRTAGASSRSARPWCARSRRPPAATGACAPETALRHGRIGPRHAAPRRRCDPHRRASARRKSFRAAARLCR